MPTSRLEVDLSAIERNLGVVRWVVGAPALADAGAGSSGGGAAPGVCAVLKQDGYGAGAVRIARRLAASGGPGAGVSMFAVYSLDEARALAEAVASVPILVLMPVHGVERSDPLYRAAAAGRLHLVVHDQDQLTCIADMSNRLGLSMPVHVQVDTGLSRGGDRPEVACGLVERVASSSRLRLAGLMTHFASPCCDAEFTREQARLFRDFAEQMGPAIAAGAKRPLGGSGEVVLHMANTCATFRSRQYHGSMVRVGQCLFGFALEESEGHLAEFEFAKSAEMLRAGFRWTSSVVHVQEIPTGWPVGYGSTWKAPKRADGKNTRIALVPVGYADGYARSLSRSDDDAAGGPRGRSMDARRQGGWVGFTGRAWERRGSAESETAGVSAAAARDGVFYAPVVGRVSMDQITVDVTDVPEGYLVPGRAGTEFAGAEVELFGADRAAPNYLPRLAANAGTVTHELLCRVGPRVERVYRVPATNENDASQHAAVAAAAV